MSGVPVQEDKRFRRAHVTPSRRGGRWPRMGWVRHGVAAALAVAAVYGAAHTVLATGLFAVRHVRVDGHARMSEGEILGLLDGLQGHSILSIDLEHWRERLKGGRWVADAHLRRIFPATIRVVIQERTPIGIGRIGDQLFLVDHTGMVIDEFGPAYAKLDLPIIDGLGAGPRGGSALVEPQRAALASRLLAALDQAPQLKGRLSQVDVSNPRDAAVILDGESVVVRLGNERFVERLQAYIDVAETLRERVADIDSVDLRFGEHVYVRPRSQARGPLARPASFPRRGKPAGE